MGWSFRRTFRLLPGIRLNLSKTGLRLSAGVSGARASVDMHGKTRIYGGKGPIRFQKTVQIHTSDSSKANTPGTFVAFLRKLLH